MRSVELALAGDYLRRGAIIFPLVLLAMIALPLWLLSLLDPTRVLGPGTREAVVLHVTLTMVIGFGASVAVFHAHGRLTRFFIRPISAARLVTCQMGLAMATVAGMYVITASIVNVTGAQWPVIGPALYLATSIACALAAIWCLEGNMLSQLFGCCATTVPLFIWFSRRYSATIMGDWETMWLQPSAGEALTLGAISATAYSLSIRGVAHTRRGDVWDFAALQAWLENLFGGNSAAPHFSSAWRAQVWCEAREKMVYAPASLMLLGMLLALIAWLSVYMETAEFLNFTLIMPVVGMTTAMPLVYGILVGNCAQEKRPGMRHFLGTRPVPDQFLAAAMLRTAATALVSSWCMWLAGVAAVMALAWLAGHQDAVGKALLPESTTAANALLIIAGVPFLSWTITTVLASLIATGRTSLVVAVISSTIAAWLSFGILKAYAPPHVFDFLLHSWLITSGVLALIGTGWAYVVATRRGLLAANVSLAALAVWLGLAGACLYFARFPREAVPLIWFVHILGVLALGILPFAAMPLAVRWNRHR